MVRSEISLLVKVITGYGLYVGGKEVIRIVILMSLG
jgi:hypothetical protein